MSTQCTALQQHTISASGQNAIVYRIHLTVAPGSYTINVTAVSEVQALPLPLLLFLVTMHTRRSWLMMLNCVLGAMRIGVLFGTMRVYRQRPWSYWLSPLCDLPVAVQLARSALRRRHIWRGRVLKCGGM